MAVKPALLTHIIMHVIILRKPNAKVSVFTGRRFSNRGQTTVLMLMGRCWPPLARSGQYAAL